jgi:hypothetical protein
MSEKENPENSEEQTQEAEISEEVEGIQASEEVAKEQAAEETETSKVETSEELGALEESEGGPEEAKAEESDNEPVKEVPAPKKGLMERRESFDQSSVPNAHKGYSPTPPIIMLLIVSAFIIVSLIFATAAVIN